MGDLIWDEGQILDEFYGDEDILLETCETFLEVYKDHLTSIRQKQADQDFLALSEEAHSIKGMVSYFNKNVVLKAAKLIEVKGREGEYSSKDDAEQDIVSLEENMEALCDYMRDFLKRQKAV